MGRECDDGQMCRRRVSPDHLGTTTEDQTASKCPYKSIKVVRGVKPSSLIVTVDEHDGEVHRIVERVRHRRPEDGVVDQRL